MTTVESTRPYHRLSDTLREDVDAALAGFRVHLSIFRKPARKPVAVAPSEPTVEPATVTDYGATEPEPEADFAPQTYTQKRTRKRGGDIEAFQKVRAAICTAGKALTGSEISAATGYNRRRTSQITSRMKAKGLLFVVGHTRGEFDWVAVYHTEPNAKQAPSASVILAEKRTARLPPSLATMDHAHAVIKENFQSNSIALRLFDLLACHGPLTATQIQNRLNTHITAVNDRLGRLAGLGLVRNESAVFVGKDAHPAALWDVVQL